MGNQLVELASYMLPLADKLIGNAQAAGIPVRVVDTGRTPSEQEAKLSAGQSWTSHSKHEPQPPEGKSEAIDVVPLAILEENKSDWDPSSPLWAELGKIGIALGLEWGGSWTSINNGYGDPSHFQYVHVAPDSGPSTVVI